MKSSWNASQYCSALLAACIPIVPAFGHALLLPIAGALLFVVWIVDRGSIRIVAAPLVLLVALWSVVLGVSEYPNIVDAFRVSKSPLVILGARSVESVRLAALLLLFGVWMFHWAHRPQSRAAALQSFLVSGTLSLLFSSVQAVLRVLHIEAPLFSDLPNQTVVWQELDRPVGLFSDPNAFGVFAALFFTLVVAKTVSSNHLVSRVLYISLSVLSLCGGALSGSRTFLVFFVLFLVLQLVQLFRTNDGSRLGFPFIVFLSGVLLVTGGLYFTFQDEGIPLKTFERVGESLHALYYGDSSLIADRLYFSYLCLLVFFQYPLTGVGPLLFRDEMTSFAYFYEIPLGLWTDNPNNSYLGLLAELGLLGVVALCLSVFLIRFYRQPKEEESFQRTIRSGLVAYLAILFFGPHYLFPEITLTVALLIALVCSMDIRSHSYRILSLFLILCFPFVPLMVAQKEMGLFHWEENPNSTNEEQMKFARWSSKNFRVWTRCESRNAELHLRNGQPRDIEVSLQTMENPFSPSERTETVRLGSGGEQSVSFPCPKNAPHQGILVRGQVSKSWQPLEYGDSRVLGVQILAANPADSFVARQIDNEFRKR
ncbi:MAG: O-antigen ligase family protein [Bdellovibrionales bacterium]|nr:O-antigen ligase family protein [Bdellovibrionales bacterium]